MMYILIIQLIVPIMCYFIGVFIGCKKAEAYLRSKYQYYEEVGKRLEK